MRVVMWPKVKLICLPDGGSWLLRYLQQQLLGIRMHAGELLGDGVLRAVLQATPAP